MKIGLVSVYEVKYHRQSLGKSANDFSAVHPSQRRKTAGRGLGPGRKACVQVGVPPAELCRAEICS